MRLSSSLWGKNESVNPAFKGRDASDRPNEHVEDGTKRREKEHSNYLRMSVGENGFGAGKHLARPFEYKPGESEWKIARAILEKITRAKN